MYSGRAKRARRRRLPFASDSAAFGVVVLHFAILQICSFPFFTLPPPPAKEKTAPQDPIFVAPTKVKVLKHASTHKNGPFFDGLFLFHSDDFVVLGFVVFDFVSLPFIARNEPKMGPKLIPNGAHNGPQNGPGIKPKMGPTRAPKWRRKRPQNVPKMDQKRSPKLTRIGF